MHDKDYAARVASEKRTYEHCLNVHDLPEIFHHWSHRKIRPKFEAFGFSNPDQMFCKYLADQCSETPGQRRFLSIGSGNCDLELAVATDLVQRGYGDFVIECMDLNPAMLERGRVAAEQAGLSAHLAFLEVDFNQWQARHEYHAVMANQALHHVVNLEGLFREVRGSLTAGGRFVISDMIGRNGHQRWPEALEIVQEYWRQLPSKYRYNVLLNRQEEEFGNWDCSQQGFEGIRAQDILPLLLDNFKFQMFVGYGNIIDPFVDRAFGHHFDVHAAWDRDFIDEIHARDEKEMYAGTIKPVHMSAVVGRDDGKALEFTAPFTPQFCVRPVEESSIQVGWRSRLRNLFR